MGGKEESIISNELDEYEDADFEDEEYDEERKNQKSHWKVDPWTLI